ncbi:hypothetical protein HBI68_252750 [Parastagonospora nodorum]|nr:hypothetical protein HBI68_252750 [Parastagonospora nodorum]
MQTSSEFGSDERQYLEGQIEELRVRCRDIERFKQDIHARDQSIRNLEHSLERCTQELTTVQDAKVAVEDRLKSCQTAAVETRDYLNAENLLLCNINDELRLDLSSLYEVIEDLRSRLENRSLEISPILQAMPSVNQRSLEEELTMVNASLSEEPSSQVHRASEEASTCADCSRR